MVQLIAVSSAGEPTGYDGDLGEHIAEVLGSTVDLYARVGFEPPWISYLAVEDDGPVGICAFKSAPVEGSVEIAYFTFPDHEGRGIASQMAAQLVALAAARPGVRVTAQTLPERNASHRILEKTGFRAVGVFQHPEDGAVLEWHFAGAGT